MQIEVAIEEKSRHERQGTDVGVLPDSELFFIDKVIKYNSYPIVQIIKSHFFSPGTLTPLSVTQAKASTPALALSSAARPSQKRKEKVLRSQAIIDAAHQARPVVKPVLGKKQHHRKTVALVKADSAAKRERPTSKTAEPYDIWDIKESDQEQPADFDTVAQAIAAKQTTPFGPLRPAKRRYA